MNEQVLRWDRIPSGVPPYCVRITGRHPAYEPNNAGYQPDENGLYMVDKCRTALLNKVPRDEIIGSLCTYSIFNKMLSKMQISGELSREDALAYRAKKKTKAVSSDEIIALFKSGKSRKEIKEMGFVPWQVESTLRGYTVNDQGKKTKRQQIVEAVKAGKSRAYITKNITPADSFSSALLDMKNRGRVTEEEYHRYVKAKA